MDDTSTSTAITCDGSDSTCASSNVENTNSGTRLIPNNNEHPSLTLNEKDEGTSMKNLAVKKVNVPVKAESDLSKEKRRQLGRPNPYLLSPEIESLQTSLRSKKTPWSMQSWIALSLTLDGRDKMTKVIQYASRLLGFYYESLVLSLTASKFEAMQWSRKAKQFRMLQKSLTSSRKAYRFGRSIIEIEKLREMGLLNLLAQYLMQKLGRASNISEMKSGNTSNDDKEEHVGKKITWHPEISPEKQQCIKTKGSSASKYSKRTLPRQVSSNIGWGPSTRTFPLYSYIYSSLSGYLEEQSGKDAEIQPSGKTIATALKLSGLAGFWAADNISYLYSTGFWESVEERGKKTAIFATRSYFLACASGLYLSMKEFLRHRSGPLSDATRQVMKCQHKLHKLDIQDKHDSNGTTSRTAGLHELEKANEDLKKLQRKHFKNSLALLKSCCDVIVFSNSTGVDLHIKYRGKKMNEGFQAVCGIASACTVLYNNFPNDL